MGDVGDSERLLRTCGRSAATFWVFGTFQYPGRHFSVFGHSLESNELGSPRAVHRHEEPAYRHGEPRGRSGKKDQSEVRGRSGTTGNQSEGGHAGVGKCPGTLRPLRGALPPRWGGRRDFFSFPSLSLGPSKLANSASQALFFLRRASSGALLCVFPDPYPSRLSSYWSLGPICWATWAEVFDSAVLGMWMRIRPRPWNALYPRASHRAHAEALGLKSRLDFRAWAAQQIRD